MLFEFKGLISLVSWTDGLIYYLIQEANGFPEAVNVYNIQTQQSQPVITIPHPTRIDSLKSSPNGKLALLDNIVVDLKTAVQVTEHSLASPLWLPDSQGLLGTLSNQSQQTLKWQIFKEQQNTPLTLSFNLPSTKFSLIAWSPDGQYLIYRDIPTNAFYLLNLTTNQKQLFTPTEVLRVSGWIYLMKRYQIVVSEVNTSASWEQHTAEIGFAADDRALNLHFQDPTQVLWGKRCCLMRLR